jgi:hypothetical protein
MLARAQEVIMSTASTFRRSLLASVIAAAAVCPPARGDKPAPPYTYTVPTPGGKYVFVMLSPLPPEKDAASWNEEEARKIRAVRARYTRSGLYRADAPAAPLWTVDWYDYGVLPASDGVHLVRPGGPASLTERFKDDPAVAFYAGGRLIRSYTVGELVDRPSLLPRSVTRRKWCKETVFDDDALRFKIHTEDGNSFVFDVRTGDLLSSNRPARARSGLLPVVVVTGLAVVIVAGVAWRRVRVRRAGARMADLSAR